MLCIINQRSGEAAAAFFLTADCIYAGLGVGGGALNGIGMQAGAGRAGTGGPRSPRGPQHVNPGAAD